MQYQIEAVALINKRGSAHSRGYGREWRRARLAFLSEHPYCVMCKEQGIQTVATVVDHSVAHRGDMELFWDKSKWIPLCEHHHNSTAQIRDLAERPSKYDTSGVPGNPKHHWNK